MTLDVSQALKQPGTAMPMDAEQAIAPVEIGGDTVTFEPARLAGSFMALEGGDIVVRGILTTRAHARCANCLSPAEADVEEEFDEVFHLGGDPDDPEIFAYTGQELELEQLAMSTAVLHIPFCWRHSTIPPGPKATSANSVPNSFPRTSGTPMRCRISLIWLS